MQTSSVAVDPYVHHGALDVPRNAERQYQSAKAYLSRDSIERDLFERLEGATDGRHFTLRINHQNNDYFNPQTDTIGWDPYSALLTTSGGRQSPALGLGHEVDHAVENPAREQHLMSKFNRSFDNAEERRVILGSETHAARTLHEDTRDDHAGDAYRVASPLRR